MTYLDCESPESTIQSLAGILGCSIETLRNAIASYEPDWTIHHEDPVRVGPREMLRALGIDVRGVRWEGTYYFHGTRVIDAQVFHRDGILPLGEVIDHIWAMLYELVRSEVTSTQWRGYRRHIENGGGDHDGFLYRLKLSKLAHQGPYSILVREHHIRPTRGTHNYLAIPEIVEDIANVVGHDVRRKFEEASVGCLVKFRTADTDTHALESALWYVHTSLRREEHGRASLYCGDQAGTAVRPKDVLGKEVVET